jgi:hypothetical protein
MKYDLIGVLAHGDAVSLTPNDAQLAGGEQGGFWHSASGCSLCARFHGRC